MPSTEPTAAPVDDFTARTGSAASLMATVAGLYLRGGAQASSAALVQLGVDLGLTAASTRSALARLKQRAVLATRSGPSPGYVVDPAAEQLFARGDRRIFAPHAMSPTDGWCLISFSLPEHQRGVRHQLRRRFAWIGCGTIAPGLWICPAHLRAEAEGILVELGVRDRAVVSTTNDLRPGVPLAKAVAEWWDLDGLATRHHAFLAATADLTTTALRDDADAFRRYVVGIDAWREIPYLDPGLPAELLPEDWPGAASTQRFEDLGRELSLAARRHARAVLGRGGSA